MSKLRDMKKRFLPLSMLLITMVLAQASFVANAAGNQGKYNPRTGSKATFSSFMKSIRANQETGLIDPAAMIAAQKAAQTTKDGELDWGYVGPDNFGGFTKAMIYDKDGNVIMGTAGGDIYKTTNNGVTFGKVGTVGFPISCMVMNEAGEIFIGTGEGRDAQILNGLSDLGEATSFIGKGIFKMVGDFISPLEATIPTSETDGWCFVNDMTIVNGKIYAATADGIRVSEDNGATWTKHLRGTFNSIKSNNNGDVLAAAVLDEVRKLDVDTANFYTVSNVYLSKAGGEFTKLTGNVLPYVGNSATKEDNVKIIAMSPNDANFMYVAYLGGTLGSYTSGNIYFTEDGGNTWKIAMAETGMYSIFGSDANHDGFMIVYPDNPRKLLIGSDDMWVFEDKMALGVNSYRPQKISENYTDPSVYYYVHQGIQTILFDKNTTNIFYVGTNGGVYKGTYAQYSYSFKNCNRYYITDDEHSSVTRMMNVGIGGNTKVLGGCLDHGTIVIEGDTTVNNVTTGEVAFPHVTNNGYASGFFTKSYAGGPCAISTIDPDIFFVSGTGALSTPIYRTENDGEDFNENFEGGGDDPVIKNANAFRTPFAFFENYNDANNPVDTLSLKVRAADTLHAGDVYYYYSLQAGYPINYTMPEPPHDNAHAWTHDSITEYIWHHGDTIKNLHDSISTLFVCGIENKLYMTRDALRFNIATEWCLISAISGIPSAVAISGDGDMALVGTLEGNMYKVTGLSNAYTAAQASVDSTECVVTFTTLGGFPDRAITSISINPSNKNSVVVTLGNYGNDSYVYKSTDAGDTFTNAQGNLAKAPVFSSLIEKGSNTIFVGTETGLYMLNNGEWVPTGNVSCPVMDIKQAYMQNHPTKVDVLYDEMGNSLEIEYPGIYNEGMIYAATYGEGIVYCETYYVPINWNENGDDNNGDDNNVVEVENEQLKVYPNPVRGQAMIDINLEENANVSYAIYDFTGRLISEIKLGTYVQGEHTLNINTNDLVKGSYIVRVKAGNKTEQAKFLVY